jgi:hypothetical protein
MQYIIVESRDTADLRKKVTAQIKAGWTLQGGIGVGYSEEPGYPSSLYVQAMIKEGDETTNPNFNKGT